VSFSFVTQFAKFSSKLAYVKTILEKYHNLIKVMGGNYDFEKKKQ
jgi:hypothetical protein